MRIRRLLLEPYRLLQDDETTTYYYANGRRGQPFHKGRMDYTQAID